MLRVVTLDELFAAVETLAHARPIRGRRLAIVSNGGGLGVLAADALLDRGGELAALEPQTSATLDACLPAAWSHSNPIDIVGDATPERYAAIVFWAIFWLGIPGGVFLAVSAALARFGIEKKDKFQWLFGIFSNVCAAFGSAFVFYLSLQKLAGFSSVWVAENPIAWHWLVAATCLMAVAHYLVSAVLNSIFQFLRDDNSFGEILKINFARTALGAWSSS